MFTKSEHKKMLEEFSEIFPKKIKKIPLEGLINVLIEIYESGIDFVDMRVERHEKQDHIWFLDSSPHTKESPVKDANIDFESLI